MLGQLEKLRIDGYRDSGFSDLIGTYHAQINPETFTRNYSVHYAGAVSAGKEGAELRYQNTLPQTMDIDLLLDATGVLPASGFPQSTPVGNIGPVMDIIQNIKDLKSIVYDYINSNHEPPFAIITWAKQTFRGRLQSINITYKLFKPDGTPLRALVKCSFRQHIPDPENAATRAESPDMTHIRIVKDGDSLPYMCYKIYKDESLYLQVARVNGLVDFRKLQVGQKLFFPPIQK